VLCIHARTHARARACTHGARASCGSEPQDSQVEHVEQIENDMVDVTLRSTSTLRGIVEAAEQKRAALAAAH
jgi:hypothetical protein